MNGYYPPAPSAPQQPQQFDPFGRYSSMAQPTADERRKQYAQQFAQQMIGQPAQTAAQGYGQLAAGIGMGLANYAKGYQEQGKQFPDAPGGAQPTFMNNLANFFTGRKTGGLY